MAELSPSDAASEVGMSVTEAAICDCDFEFLREKLISVHSGGLATRAGSDGGRG
jgi:hypothetical protein